MKRQGESANGCGDLNFTAACMAVGIPLDESLPAVAVKRDNGRDYCRWFLLGSSIDGKLSMGKTNAAWRNPDEMTGVEELNGFCWVMEFIRRRPDGVRRAGDWLTWAHDYLRECGVVGSFMWPRRLEDVAEFVALHPDDREGHVFAFVLNRDLCLWLARQAQETPRLMMSRGAGHTLLRESAPKWRQRQFLDAIG